MTRCILSLCLCLFFFSASAHQADLSSTLLVEQENNSWILQVRSPLTAFEFEIEKKYGPSAYTSAEEFQELVVQLLQEHVSILFNEHEMGVLEGGLVKLGHETNVIFKVSGVPKEFDNLKVKNSTFKDIRRNQSALVIMKKGFTQKQFVLNNENQHTAQLAVKNAQFVSLNPTSEKAMVALPNVFVGIALAGFLGLFLLLRFRPKKANVQNFKNEVPDKLYIR